MRRKGLEFLLEIARSLNVALEKGENGNHYAERVILSAGAMWMLTAVHNEEKKVSVESIKNVAAQKIESYLEIIDYHPFSDVQPMVQYLYDVLLANGMFYHEPQYVRPMRNRFVGIGDIAFVRGLLPEENVRFSGMAPYVLGSGEADLADEFMLWNRSAEETLRCAWKHSSPQDNQIVISEYLRADHQQYQRYYDVRRHDEAEITIGRTRRIESFGHDYYLIRGDEIRRFTDDYIKASVHEYTTLAIVNGERKQIVTARFGKKLIDLELGYLLPKPDERFLRFVSWPESIQKLDNPLYRVSLHPRLWPVVRERLIFLGYEVEEEHE